MEHYDESQLLCHSTRMVSGRGVHVCPILVDDPRGFMGDDLEASMRPYRLQAAACYTCYLYGSICSNASSASAGDPAGY